MEFKTPLLHGHLIKRYKRFLADIELEGKGFITAHCPNSGAMQGLSDPGTPVWVSHSPNPARKLPYTWEMAEVNSTYVGANTSHPNFLVTEALQAGSIPELQGFAELKREVSYGKNSRIDILLTHPSGQLTYVEVKNVHLKRDNRAAFPSSVTARGAKHMRELVDMVEAGHQAYIIYVVQRNDCSAFEIAGDIDPFYQEESLKAFGKGVKPLVYACDISPKGITLTHPLIFNYE
jgi:sugar fermentation stimulation protein A